MLSQFFSAKEGGEIIYFLLLIIERKYNILSQFICKINREDKGLNFKNYYLISQKYENYE